MYDRSVNFVNTVIVNNWTAKKVTAISPKVSYIWTVVANWSMSHTVKFSTMANKKLDQSRNEQIETKNCKHMYCLDQPLGFN